MSIQSAIDFMHTAGTDDTLRKSCYGCRTQEALLGHLQASGFSFTADEFEDAVNHLLLRCQTAGQAERVQEWRAWFSLFVQ